MWIISKDWLRYIYLLWYAYSYILAGRLIDESFIAVMSYGRMATLRKIDEAGQKVSKEKYENKKNN